MIPEATGLHPKLADTIPQILTEAKARGLSVGLHSGLRSIIEQDRLYSLGRERSNPDGKTLANPRGNIVTKTTGGYSWHNHGVACDIVFKDDKGNWTWDKSTDQWEDLGKIGEMLGLEWGGRWKMKDYPHFQLKGLPSIDQAFEIASKQGIEKLWAMI